MHTEKEGNWKPFFISKLVLLVFYGMAMVLCWYFKLRIFLAFLCPFFFAFALSHLERDLALMRVSLPITSTP